MGLNTAIRAGFSPTRKTYLLDFSGVPDLDGLEVRARGASLGKVMQLGKLGDAVEEASNTTAEMEALDALLELFDEVLISWNLLDDAGAPVPADVEGLKSLEVGHVMAVFLAWQSAVAAVPVPLPVASNAGSPSVARSMPMETALPSLAS